MEKRDATFLSALCFVPLCWHFYCSLSLSCKQRNVNCYLTITRSHVSCGNVDWYWFSR